MERIEFTLGTEFTCGNKKWRTTDIGTRVIIAICLEPHIVVSLKNGVETQYMTDDTEWFNGPTYAVEEVVFEPKARLRVCRLTTRKPIPKKTS